MNSGKIENDELRSQGLKIVDTANTKSSKLKNEDDLISKKELLQMFNISYGAFYRYKRKGLLPEQWFIRLSTYTGQETFLPRKLAIKRLKDIQNGKKIKQLDLLASDYTDEKIEVDVKFLISQLSNNDICKLLKKSLKESPRKKLSYSYAKAFVALDIIYENREFEPKKIEIRAQEVFEKVREKK